MSGGQRQRVALGRAIVRSPKAFLMDEPLSNLDAALRVHTRGEIVELHRRLGATTIYVTHDQEEALSMADKIAVMKDGHILQFASPRSIYADPDHLEVAEFIGTPKINIIAADVSQTGVVEIGGEGVAEGFDAWRGKLVTVGVRPDQAELVPDEPHIPGQHRVPFHLDRLEFLGSEAIAHGTLTSGSTIRVRVEPISAKNTAIAHWRSSSRAKACLSLRPMAHAFARPSLRLASSLMRRVPMSDLSATALLHARREERAGWWLSLPAYVLILVLLILPTLAMLACRRRISNSARRTGISSACRISSI